MIARSLVLFGMAVALASAGARVAAAETWPSHPLTMLVPFPAGGPTDALARIMAERLTRALGQSVVVDNVSGAGGTVGTAKVGRAPADGYTLCIGQLTSHVFSPAVYATPYDVQADFQPIGVISISALMLIGRADLPATLPELIAWLKTTPQPATVGTIGVGSPAHVWTVEFAKLTGARFQLVPYRGAAPVMQDMLAGRVDLAALEASSSLPYVQGGKVRGFAILSPQRWKVAPGIPTLAELGFPGYEMPFWSGLWVRKGTPPDIVAKLDAALLESLADPAVVKRLTDLGQEIPARAEQTPEGLAARHRGDIEKWWPLIKAANLKAE
ncbi:MAG TPA: tripartite tricarboxylate transporter substrate binding protein [Reyranella sp.]|nr:tripartite tricarboxylate transporter substrate binding protein [Reyranella sp.]